MQSRWKFEVKELVMLLLNAKRERKYEGDWYLKLNELAYCLCFDPSMKNSFKTYVGETEWSKAKGFLISYVILKQMLNRLQS